MDNIYALVWRTNSAMLELGLTDATVGHYRNEGLAIILNRHYESGTDRFSGEILDQIVAEKRIQYEYGQIGRGSYQNLRKAAYWIQEMHQTGHITLAKVPNWGQRELVEPFNSLLREFCTHTKQSESMAETTRNVARSAAGYMRTSVIIALCCGVVGLALSYYLNTSAGAAIVLCCAAVYFVTLPMRRK